MKYEDFEEGFIQKDPFDEQYTDALLSVSDVDLVWLGIWPRGPLSQQRDGCDKSDICILFGAISACVIMLYSIEVYRGHAP